MIRGAARRAIQASVAAFIAVAAAVPTATTAGTQDVDQALPRRSGETVVHRGGRSFPVRPLQTVRTRDGREASTGRIVVGYRDGTSPAERTAVHHRANATAAFDARPAAAVGGHAEAVHVREGADVEEVVASYLSDPRVLYAEPDVIHRAFDVPNDEFFSQQWGMASIQATTGWSTTHGSSPVTVGILDCGIYEAGSTTYGPGHPDINGKVVARRDFSGSPYGPDDLCDHGTHVAGIVAASTNNSIGVAGVGWDVRLVNAKVLDDTGAGASSTVAQGIYWATDVGVKVVNLSLGAAGPCPRILQDAIDHAWARNVVVVAAAGNAGVDVPNSPANCHHVVSVASTDASDQRSSFSNYGSWVDVAAPGGTDGLGRRILSTDYIGTYAAKSGTSMAAPHVAGLAGLLWSTGRYGLASEVTDRITSTADKVSGTGAYWQHGRINAFRALRSPPSASPGSYVALQPARVADTRPGSGMPYAGRTLEPGDVLSVQVTGRGGVPSGASAVVLNVTVTNASTGGYLTVYPDGAARPSASNLNFRPGQTVPNLVEVALGSEGQATLYNAFGRVDVVVDVQGYVSGATGLAGGFTGLNPARIADTRAGSSQNYSGQRLAPGGSLDVQVTSRGGIPATGVSAAVLNVTVTNPTAAGFLTVYPTGSTRPLASNLNFLASETVPNRVIVPVGAGGKVTLYNAAGHVDVVADVNGWFTDGTDPAVVGAAFSGLTPARIADTRPGSGRPNAGETLAAGSSRTVQVAGVGGVPASATAAVLNVTVTNASARSYLTVWPAGVPQPHASDLNWVAGDTRPNLVVVKLESNGAVNVYNSSGNVDVMVDVAGWYA